MTDPVDELENLFSFSVVAAIIEHWQRRLGMPPQASHLGPPQLGMQSPHQGPPHPALPPHMVQPHPQMPPPDQ
ncbi:unnamed protein product, partial [Mesorhabditis spiculigera]